MPLDNTLFPEIDLCGKGALEKVNKSWLFEYLPIAQQAGTSLITVEDNLRLDHGFDFIFARSFVSMISYSPNDGDSRVSKNIKV